MTDPVAPLTAEEAQPLSAGKPWLVRLTCCGRADGVFAAATWEEADAFRDSYLTAGDGPYAHIPGLGEDALAARSVRG